MERNSATEGAKSLANNAMSETANPEARTEEPIHSEIDEHYGTVSLSKERVTAGAYDTWQITYKIGKVTLDDGAKIKIATNQTSDWGRPQFEDATAENYATVETDGDATVEGRFDRYYRNPRPWNDNIVIDIYDGYLENGDTITVTFGDTTDGNMGHQVQSFPETAFEFRFFVDMLGTGDFVSLDELAYEIVAGKPARLQAIAPSSVELGEDAEIVVRALDYWYNTAAEFDDTLVIEVGDGTEKLTFEADESVSHIPITFTEKGVNRVTVTDTDRDWSATTNPIVVGSDGEYDVHWGDIHGQSGKTVGTGSIDEYFEFAREEGLLDFVSHAANDFQVTEEYWSDIQEAVSQYHDPGEFVTFLCNEWSSTAPNGGDNNVYYRNDDEPLLRSTGWQAADGFEKHEGTYHIEDLYAEYTGRDDALIIPHQGGRPGQLRTAEDLDLGLSPLIEICSIWGVFEWFGQEALERGYEVGFIAGSDDHTGRLGAARPTNHFEVDERASLQAADFNIKGGLMAVSVSDLTRESVWSAMQERRCYGTTGERILLDVDLDGANMGAKVVLDNSEATTFDVSVNGTAPIKRVDLFDGSERLATKDCTVGSGRLELEWSGARSKNRHKVQDASGGLTLDTGRIARAEEFGFDHPEQGITRTTDSTIEWNSTISGNYQGVTLDLDAPATAEIGFHTPFLDTSFTLDELGRETIVDAGHLHKQLAVRHIGKPVDLDVDASFGLTDAESGDHAYYVRVVQEDGGMAWSSPVFVSVE